MNYRHMYHAGNIADVFKHTVLVALLERMIEKESPFFVLDTHAGIGLYDLEAGAAQKTLESVDGIITFQENEPPDFFEAYRQILRRVNEGNALQQAWRYYPGSPIFIQQFLRPQDQFVACELHPDDARDLKRRFYNDPRVHIHHRDGYEALRAFLPPTQKRGLVLIDPPYEQAQELEALPARVQEAINRWPQGSFVIWYPIKERPALWRFHEALIEAGIPKQLCVEFIYQDESRSDRLNGAGLIVINGPWKFNSALEAMLPALHEALRTKTRETRIQWLTPA